MYCTYELNTFDTIAWWKFIGKFKTDVKGKVGVAENDSK